MVAALVRGVYLSTIGAALIGYAFLGRGFAYIGFPPIYVDALLYGLAALVLVLTPGWLYLLRVPHTWVLILLMTWGFVRTIPYIPIYGIDALRDAVIWAWGLFALATGYTLARRDLFQRIVQWYGKWIYAFVIWAPVALGVYWLFRDSLPKFPWGPGGGVPVLNPKVGDIAVHLAGAVAFVFLVRPYIRSRYTTFRNAQEWVFWTGWLLSFVAAGFIGRAAFITVLLALVVLTLHVNPARWVKLITILLTIFALFAVSGVEIDIGRERNISFYQLITNLYSVIGEAEGFSGEGSERWRRNWWSEIIKYTFHGDYFWTGKGFGINLADADGYQVLADRSLRNPHNGHLTMLARSGVPGFSLWCLFQLSFGIALWRRYLKYRMHKLGFEAGLYLWIFVYWMAAMVNATFDVYLEGPQGGVWFWNIVGVGLGLLLRDRWVRVQLASREPWSQRPPARSPDTRRLTAHQS